jgi:hypothetical protein
MILLVQLNNFYEEKCMSDFSIKPSEGISIKNLSDRIMKKYDQNKDNFIDVNKESSVKEVFSKDSIISTKYSMGSLFKDADNKSNKDGKVSKSELYEFISTFDKNKDGDIDGAPLIKILMGKKGELENFESKYLETRESKDLRD